MHKKARSFIPDVAGWKYKESLENHRIQSDDDGIDTINKCGFIAMRRTDNDSSEWQGPLASAETAVPDISLRVGDRDSGRLKSVKSMRWRKHG